MENKEKFDNENTNIEENQVLQEENQILHTEGNVQDLQQQEVAPDNVEIQKQQETEQVANSTQQDLVLPQQVADTEQAQIASTDKKEKKQKKDKKSKKEKKSKKNKKSDIEKDSYFNDYAFDEDELYDDTGKKPKNRKNKKKKKRHGCLRACCVGLIICLVLVVAAGGVGYYFGNNFLKSNYGISLNEIFSTWGNLKSSSEKKVVKNKFTQNDFDSAENSLKVALFLKEDANFSLEEMVDIFLEDAVKDDSNLYKQAVKGSDVEETSKTDKLMAYLKEVMVYENLDIEKLKNFDESKLDDYKVTFTDKEIGAILQYVLERILTSDMVTGELEEALKEFGMSIEQLALQENLQIKQVIFNNENGESRIKFTVGLKVHTLINNLLKGFEAEGLVGEGGISEAIEIGATLLKPLIKTILPKNILLTADIGLRAGSEAKFYINDMNDKQMNKAYNLIKKIGDIAGSSIDIKQKLNEPFMEGGAVYDALNDINQNIINLNSVVADGKLTADVIQVGIDALKLNYVKDSSGNEVLKDPSEQIHSKDIYNGLSVVFGTSVDDVLGENGSKTAFDYNNIKVLFDDNGNLILDEDGFPKYEFVYQYHALLLEQGKNIIDEYEKAFLQEMQNCYGLSADVDFDQIIKIFSGLEGATTDVLNLFDAEKLKDIIQNERRGGVISDTMLAAIVSSRMGDFFGEETDLLNKFEFKYLILSNNEQTNHSFAEVGIYLKLADLMEGELEKNEFADILLNILPEGFVVSCKIDITFGASSYERTEIKLNDSSKTQGIFDMIDALGVLGKDDEGNNIKLSNYLDDMLTPIRDTLGEMTQTLPGLTFGTSKLMLPDVFDAVAAFINSGMDLENKIDSAELAQALKIIISDAPQNDYDSLTQADFDNYGKALLQELNEKFALKADDGKGNDYTLTDILQKLGLTSGNVNIDDIIDLIDSQQFESLINASSISGAMLTDSQSSNDMLVALIREVVGEFLSAEIQEYLSSEDILGVKVEEENSKTYISLVVKADLATMLSSNMSGEDAIVDFVTGLLPEDIYLSIKLDVTANAQAYDEIDIEYNFNSESQKVLDLIEAFGIELPTADIEESVRSAIDDLTSNEMIGISLVDGGIQTNSIFGVVTSIINDISEGEQLTVTEVKDSLKVLITEAGNNQYSGLTTSEFSNYGKALINELNAKLAISKKDESNVDYTLTDILQKLGLTSSNVNIDDIIDLIDAQQFESLINASSISGAMLTDSQSSNDMLVALIREVVGEFLSAEVQEYLSAEDILGVKVEEENSKTYISLVVKADLATMLSSNMSGEDAIVDFVTGLLPEDIYLSIELDVTSNAQAYDEIDIEYNFNSESQKVLDLIDAFGIELPTADIEESVRSAIDDLTSNEMIEISLVDGGIQTNSIFGVVTSIANEDASEQDKLTEQEVKDSLKVLITEAGNNQYTGLGSDDFNDYGKALINEFNTKLAIRKKDKINNTDYTLTDIVEKLGLTSGSATTDDIIDMIDSQQFESLINASSISGAMLTDSQSSNDMLVALIREVVGEFLSAEAQEYLSAEDILGVKVEEENSKTYMSLVVKADLATMLSSNMSGEDAIVDFVTNLLPEDIYLSIELDVTSNAQAYDEIDIEYNFNSESQKVLDLIDAFGIELPTADIEESVRSAIDDLTSNEKIGISFVDKGMAIDNIFDMMNKVVFETNLSDEEIKIALKAIYKSSDVKIGNYFESNGISTIAPSQNYSTFLTDITDKYFINTENVTFNTFDDIFAVIEDGGDALHPSTINLNKLKHTSLTIDQLKPIMSYADMGALFNEKLAGSLNLVSLTNTNTAHGNILTVYAKVNLADYLGSSDIDLADVITVSQLMVSVQIDMGTVLTTGTGSKYYKTICNINDMSTAEFDYLKIILNKFSADFGEQIDDAGVDAGKSAYEAFAQLDSNLCGNYMFTESGLKISDIFSFIGQQYLEPTTDYDAQALKVKKAIQSLYEASGSENSQYNFTESDIVTNPISTSNEIPVPNYTTLLNTGIIDNDLGLYTEAKLMELGENVGQIKQLSILPANYSTDANGKVSKEIAHINAFKENSVQSGHDYILITDKIKLTNIIGDIDSHLVDLMPEKVYVSFLLEFDRTQSKFKYASYFRINDMDYEAEETLIKLMGITLQTLDDTIEGNADRCINPINSLFSTISVPIIPGVNITITHNFTENLDATTSKGKYSISVSY